MEKQNKTGSIIIGVVALYKPKPDEIANIEKYIEGLDYCYLADDSAEDNSSLFEDFIDRYRDKIEYYTNEKNIGLCASVNNGITKAMEKGADWVLIMNPDGTFSNDALRIYRNYIDYNTTDDVAIIAPTFNIVRHPRQAGVGSRKIKYADMTGCLYNTSIMKKIGMYDTKTYFYGLDTEYCMRVKKQGYKIIECSEAVLNHNPAETRELKIFGKCIFAYGIDPPKRFYYQFRTSYYIHQLYGLSWNDFFMLYKYLKVVFLFEHKREYFNAIGKGIKDAKRGYYGK